jgi:hypothetical protein
MTNKEIFLETYKQELIKSHAKDPTQYAWPISELDVVFKRMCDAIERGSFSKESSAIKATCKALKIKHTYRDIENFINS